MITDKDALSYLIKMAQKAKRNLDNAKDTMTEEQLTNLRTKYEALSWAVGCCINDMKFNGDYHIASATALQWAGPNM